MAGRLTLLVDSNVWLELLLEQEQEDQVRQFLKQVDPRQVALTDFSVHSIGISLLRLKKESLFEQFISDIIEDSPTQIANLTGGDLRHVVAVHQRYALDFDDAYQYVAAEQYDLTLVSFDADFDRTERGRKTPEQILETL